MACNLTKGRALLCRDTVGGVKSIYFAQHDEITSYTAAAGEVTDFSMTGGHDVYRYFLKRGTAGVTETINASSENGTVFYTHSINIKLHKLTKEDQNQIKLLAAQRMVIFAELNELNDNGKNVVLAMGLDNGMELSAGTNASGAALGDRNGYDWTFESQEPNPIQVNEDYTTNPLDSSGFVINAVVSS